MTIEVPLLKHKAHFRPLSWRVELKIHLTSDAQNVQDEILAAAMVDVSDTKSVL